MTIRVRAAEVGANDARRMTARMATELREARLAAGVSQAAVARAAGISRSTLSRMEREQLADPTLLTICRVGRALALAPSFRFFPSGVPVRDAPQLSLLARLRAILGSPLGLEREVALPIEGDGRAWDAMITGADQPGFVEAESHLLDVQAFQRRVALKIRDDPRVGVVILVLTRSAYHRALLAEHRESLRAQFPLDGGAVLRALRAGRLPPLSGIILV
jgi:transcriptional regulator with XRE-family HTH domain